MTVSGNKLTAGVGPTQDSCASASLTLLVARYERGLFNFLLALLHHREHAQDCLQETYARAYENLARDKPVTSTWLYKVARNLATDVVRQRRRFPAGSQPLEDVHEPEQYEAATSVRRVMAQLTVADRELLYLCDVDDMSASEIASVLGIREGAVRTRGFRARERFRRAFEEERSRA